MGAWGICFCEFGGLGLFKIDAHGLEFCGD